MLVIVDSDKVGISGLGLTGGPFVPVNGFQSNTRLFIMVSNSPGIFIYPPPTLVDELRGRTFMEAASA
ncbi:MAG: hypothetical protein KA314_28965 [Chloroflexi bacterium]|nr:hypothetical protein [Chloroflexota bacterium]MBP8059889.1 hypothetical protein [Chloroflexota bacterium]